MSQGGQVDESEARVGSVWELGCNRAVAGVVYT